MKKGKALRFLAAVLAACMMAAGIPEISTEAVVEKYYANEKIDYSNNYGEFTEEEIMYIISKKPVGSTPGEVYVNGCNFRITKLSVPASVKHGGLKYNVIGINDGAFINYENLVSVTIAEGISYIGGGAFWGCYGLESISLPKSTKELKDSVFKYCGSLKSVELPATITVIPHDCFAYSGISRIIFGGKVTAIEYGAFSNCLGLKEITLPKTIKSIESGAFWGSYNLANIVNADKISDQSIFSDTKWYYENKEEYNERELYSSDIVMSIILDGEKVSDGHLYFCADFYQGRYKGLPYDDYEKGIFVELKKNSNGDFIMPKEYLECTGSVITGDFYFTDSATDDFKENYRFTFRSTNVPSEYDLRDEKYYENEVRPVLLYSVKYEQGDIPAVFLPKDCVVGKYGYGGTFGENGSDLYMTHFGQIKYPLAAGGVLAYYADENGKRIDGYKEITGAVRLHPVFVQEENACDDPKYLSYYDWQYSRYIGNGSGETERKLVKVTSAEQLLDRLMQEDTDKQGICVIDTKLTLNASAVKGYLKNYSGNSEYKFYDRGDGTYSVYNRDDFIIIRSGGELVLDGVCLSNNLRMTVRESGKLTIKNDAKLTGTLSVMKGGQVTVLDGSIEAALLNNGTVTVETPANKYATDSFSDTCISTGFLFNTGTINIDYGRFSLRNRFDTDVYPGDTKADLFDVDDSVLINDGIINITGYGHLEMQSGFQKTSHKEAYADAPFVNNGTINVTVSSERYFEFSAIDIRHNRFYNYGKIKLSTDVMYNYTADNYAVRCADWEGPSASFMLDESELINYGTIDINAKDGTGMVIYYDYFPRDMVINRFEEDGDTASHSRLENKKGGKINITTNNGCGIALGRHAYLINDGTVTIKEKAENPSNVSMLVGGKIINNSKITNNGIIGYSTAEMVATDKNYAQDIGYSGKKWTGKGSEMLHYVIDLYKMIDYETKRDIYITSGKRILVDGDSNGICGTQAEVFLPVNTKVKLDVKVSGYADKTVEYTTAKSVSDYLSEAYKNLKASKNWIKEITVSMSKGTSTASKNVTPRPIDIGTQIIAGDNYYTVLTSNLKGGTVRFLHSWNKASITIPATVTYEGRTYKVTEISKGALNFYTSMTSVTIGSNIEYIANDVFMGCTALKTVTIQSSKLTKDSTAPAAFEGIPKTAKVTVPKKKLKAYKKWIFDKGLDSKTSIKGK